MSTDIKLDFITGKMLNEFVSGKNKILQQIKIAVRIWKEDWKLNSEYGVDYDTKMNKPSILLSQIKEMILQVEGVVAINSLILTPDFESTGKGTFIINGSIQLDVETINLENERIS